MSVSLENHMHMQAITEFLSPKVNKKAQTTCVPDKANPSISHSILKHVIHPAIFACDGKTGQFSSLSQCIMHAKMEQYLP